MRDAHGTVTAGVVRCIAAHPGMSASRVAELLDVSPRTLRNRIARANEELAGVARIERRAIGYALEIVDPAAFERWEAALDASAGQQVPSSPRERASWLVNDLVSRTSWVSIDALAEALFCSRRTISNDLVAVEAYLDNFDIRLERRPHYGIRAVGTEIERRVCLANNLLDRMGVEGIVPGGGLRKASAEDGRRGAGETIEHAFKLEKMNACVGEVLACEDFHVNSVAYQNLLVHLAIAVARVRAGCYAEASSEQVERLRSLGAWDIAGQIAQAIDEEFAVELPEGEVAYIAVHLAGKRAMHPQDPEKTVQGMASKDGVSSGRRVVSDGPQERSCGHGVASGDAAPMDGDDLAPITDEVWGVVSRMLDVVREMFHVDLADNLELRMNLARHLVPLSVRLTYRMRLENPLLDDIRSRYPLAYSFARESSHVLVDQWGAPVSEDEIGYLALSFALAIECSRAASVQPKNLLIVCASGVGSARLLEMRCREEFGGQIGTVRTCDSSQVRDIDYSGIDCVLTTVPLAEELPVPVFEIGYFLDDGDLDVVRDVFGTPSSSPVFRARDYFSRRLFIPHLAATTREEAIAELCASARAGERIAPDFEELVYRREGSASTAFGNGVAIPHPLVAAAERTFVVVGLADDAIDWGGAQVRLILLLAVSRDGAEDLGAFYESLLGFVGSSSAVERLLEERTFESLCSMFSDSGAVP